MITYEYDHSECLRDSVETCGEQLCVGSSYAKSLKDSGRVVCDNLYMLAYIDWAIGKTYVDTSQVLACHQKQTNGNSVSGAFLPKSLEHVFHGHASPVGWRRHDNLFPDIR